MGRTQRRRQAVNLSFFHQGVALLRVGVDDRRIDDAIFASGNRPQLRLDGDAFAVRQRNQMASDGEVFAERQNINM